jgi:hypothetical protein
MPGWYGAKTALRAFSPGMTVKNCGAEAKNPTQLWIT